MPREVLIERMKNLGKHYLVLWGVLVLIGGCEGGRSDSWNAPYSPSLAIEGIAWDPPSTIVRRAEGSDNWAMTWASDDNLYACWGDGNGFGKSDAGLGVARIEGFPENFRGFNVWGVPRGYTGGKSYGILSVGGILYMWVGPDGGWTGNTESWLMWSENLGKSWQSSEIFFRYTDGFSSPTFLNFGKDNAGARDHYVYVYSFDASKGDKGPYTKINLARVLKERIKDRGSFEFYKGLDEIGNPVWTARVAERVAVFTDARGGVGLPSVSFHPGIRRYLLVVPHRKPLSPAAGFGIFDGPGPGGLWIFPAGGLGIFDGPEPWGPWTRVEYKDSWMGSKNMFFANIPTKWISLDGLSFYLVFTGFGRDPVAKDAYQHIRGSILISGDKRR